MQAKVTKIDDGKVTIRVRRSSKIEILSKRNYTLRVGDLVEVRRQTNNPFPILISVL